MTTTSQAWTPAGMSFLDRTNMPTECACCGRDGLKRTVKMAAPDGGIAWMGSTCAARAMGIDGPTFRNLARDADTAVGAVEAAARAAANKLADDSWGAFLNERAPGLSRAEQIAALGGFAAARAAHKAA